MSAARSVENTPKVYLRESKNTSLRGFSLSRKLFVEYVILSGAACSAKRLQLLKRARRNVCSVEQFVEHIAGWPSYTSSMY